MTELIDLTTDDGLPQTLPNFRHEYAVIAQADGQTWERVSDVTTDKAEADTWLDQTIGGVLVSRDTSAWAPVPPPRDWKPYDGSMDRIVGEFIADEYRIIKDALDRGRDIVITRPEQPATRTAHLLGCPGLTTVLDRDTAWDTRFRERLAENHDTRAPMPVFVTRDDAQRMEGIHECRTCEPGISSTAPRIRSLNAEGLADRHIGQTLTTEHGTPLGVIQTVDSHTSSETAQRWGADRVTVRTDTGIHELGGKDRIHILRSVAEANIANREAELRKKVGAA